MNKFKSLNKVNSKNRNQYIKINKLRKLNKFDCFKQQNTLCA